MLILLQQRGNTPFNTVEEFVQAGDIGEYTSVDMADFLQQHGIDDHLAYGEVLPIIRGIYDQNLSISGTPTLS